MDGFALSLFFFFSSRRRHTRFKCDWSSDVCSSDLIAASASWSAPFMSFLTCTMPVQSPLCGPKAPTKSWPASPASPSARQMPRPHNLCHEPLLQDTSCCLSNSLSLIDGAVEDRGDLAHFVREGDEFLGK